MKNLLVSAGTASTTEPTTTSTTEESTTMDDIYTYDELAAILGALTTEESTTEAEEQGYFYVDLTVSLDLELQLIM